MSEPITASAPGKLVLIGEYSVLFGSPAAVLAIDRRAVVRLTPSTDESWSVLSPGLATEPTRFDLRDDGRVDWDASASDRYSLVATLVESLVASGLIEFREIKPCAMELDTRAFFHQMPGGPAKLGVGSSAALTTALASALACWAGRDDVLKPDIDWLRRLLGLHREFQGGRGSGIDLAASVVGGVVEYQLDDRGSAAIADPLVQPSELGVLLVWTGRSADTSRFLGDLERSMKSNRRGIEGALERLGSLARRGIEGIRRANVSSFLETYDAFGDAMEALGREAGLTIMSEEHLSLRQLVRGCGAHYKPSGAGGGDMGIALTDDPEIAARTAEAVRASGFQIVDAKIDPNGLAVEK